MDMTLCHIKHRIYVMLVHFAIYNSIHNLSKSIKHIIGISVVYFYGVSNVNENMFNGFGNLVI